MNEHWRIQKFGIGVDGGRIELGSEDPMQTVFFKFYSKTVHFVQNFDVLQCIQSIGGRGAVPVESATEY